jgi:hypothetical protein
MSIDNLVIFLGEKGGGGVVMMDKEKDGSPFFSSCKGQGSDQMRRS